MAFPQSFMDELTARSDIVDVVGSYVQLTRKGSNLFGRWWSRTKMAAFMINSATGSCCR